MTAIFKRDFRSYYNSPIAYVLTGLFMVVLSLYYMSSLESGVASFSSNFIGAMSYMLIFIVPLLTMRVFTEDRRNGTEVLLLTSPNRITSIVVGKFLASFCVFLVMIAVSLVFPIILMIYGKPDVPVMLSAYLGLILYGAVYISIGVFASSLTENQIVSAIITFVILFALMAIDYISYLTGGILAKIFTWLSLTTRYNDFTTGVLDFTSIIFMLSFTVVFIYLTVRVIEKKRWSQG